jgi:hypothetical protein
MVSKKRVMRATFEPKREVGECYMIRDFIIFTPHQINEDEMGGACRFDRNINEMRPLEDSDNNKMDLKVLKWYHRREGWIHLAQDKDM